MKKLSLVAGAATLLVAGSAVGISTAGATPTVKAKAAGGARGPRGKRGPRGFKGARGPAGATGPAGPAGAGGTSFDALVANSGGTESVTVNKITIREINTGTSCGPVQLINDNTTVPLEVARNAGPYAMQTNASAPLTLAAANGSVVFTAAFADGSPAGTGSVGDVTITTGAGGCLTTGQF